MERGGFTGAVGKDEVGVGVFEDGGGEEEKGDGGEVGSGQGALWLPQASGH